LEEAWVLDLFNLSLLTGWATANKMINMVLETCPGKKISKALSSGWNP
jgi:hypothetical protein